jgi:hypothetical protein
MRGGREREERGKREGREREEREDREERAREGNYSVWLDSDTRLEYGDLEMEQTHDFIKLKYGYIYL